MWRKSWKSLTYQYQCTNNIVHGVVTELSPEKKSKKDERRKYFCSGMSDGKSCLQVVSSEPSSRSIIYLYLLLYKKEAIYICGLSSSPWTWYGFADFDEQVSKGAMFDNLESAQSGRCARNFWLKRGEARLLECPLMEAVDTKVYTDDVQQCYYGESGWNKWI